MKAPPVVLLKQSSVSTAAPSGMLQRKCDCGNHTVAGGECASCANKKGGLQRRLAIGATDDPLEKEADQVADKVLTARPQSGIGGAPLRIQRYAGQSTAETDDVPSSVDRVLAGSGRPLEPALREDMEQRFGYDFSHIRVHTDAQAAESAQSVHALAYTVGRDVVFAPGQYTPHSEPGRRLLAHELTHTLQQSATTSLQRRASPYIKKITVHLNPTQSADLEWEGTAPAGAPGIDHFTVSTGKGYGDPGDPAGTCTRNCCSDALTQCAPPWNQPGRVGACCTYFGSTFWTGTPEAEHGGTGGWKFWTPIEPYYSTRGIALHQHPDVTGQPIGHGCVRMAEDNAHRIAEFSNGRRTNVTIDGRAAPVACEAARQCGATTGSGSGASLESEGADERMASTDAAVEGLEGEMS